MKDLLAQARLYEQNAISRLSKAERPIYHFSVPTGWLNDPNGFSDYNGEHHLFFQYNPYATHWDTMHWGHAKSNDFILWEYLPAALAPDQTYDHAGVFSGSALEEDNRQILIYTGVAEHVENNYKQICQTQCIAIGDGINYKKISSNPVISSELLPDGCSKEDFRDPKIWKENGIYYVVAGSRNVDGSGQIALFYSKNLTDWHFGSILDRSQNKLGRMWECPDFFALDDKHILLISPQDMLADGLEFHNGNNAICLIGSYDKETMQFTRSSVQNVDYGLDFYAPQTMLTADGRRVMIAWMQSWDTRLCPENFSWYGMMTCPRELSVKNNRLYQQPVRELEKYRTNHIRYLDIYKETEDFSLPKIEGRSLDLTIHLKGGDYQSFAVRLASDTNYYSEILYNRKNGTLTFDRTYSGYRRDIISTRSIKVEEESGELFMRILLDRYSAEIFINGGRQVMSSLIYTPQSAKGIIFSSVGSVYMNITKYDIKDRIEN